ncbi:MAG: type II toxin-antitoxin system ParD family antitoxin [Chloroflexia bacterium]|nr:type II toxin-antitoxin system ParD family antitoxin [Chloroflexia bacterium]
MVIHVPADIEASIRERVESGDYSDTTEVMRIALRLLDARERRIEEIRASIAKGIAEIERGEGIELTPELMDEIEREVEERVRLGEMPKPDVCP